jgi:hypothetical protein
MNNNATTEGNLPSRCPVGRDKDLVRVCTLNILIIRLTDHSREETETHWVYIHEKSASLAQQTFRVPSREEIQPAALRRRKKNIALGA